MFSRRKRGGQPLVVEDCWAIKKARINGCRKKRNFGDEPELDDAAVQNEQELDDVVMQNEAVFDLVMHHDQHLDDDVVQNVVQTEVVAADVLQTEPILQVVLPIEATGVVVQTEPHVDVVVPTPAVLASPVMKIKRLSELGVVRSKSGKKKKKSSAKKK